MWVLNILLRPSFGGAPGLSIGPSPYLRGVSHIRVGRNFRAGRHLRLEAILSHNGRQFNPMIEIGRDVSMSDFVHIGATGRITIGDRVLMGSGIFISDHNHGRYEGAGASAPTVPPQERPVSEGVPITIESDVWLGEAVCILPGVKIGRGSIVGCGSVVTRDIPAHSIAAGNPARVVKSYDPDNCCWKSVA